jgi:hypothetical protein
MIVNIVRSLLSLDRSVAFNHSKVQSNDSNVLNGQNEPNGLNERVGA